MGAARMTVFEPSTLHQLVDDAESRPFVLGLARTYLRLLDRRVTRLSTAVHHGDVVTAMDAALSLKVSSTMTGAVMLADLAVGIERDLRFGDLRSARSRATLLQAAAERTDAAVTAYLQDVVRAERTQQAEAAAQLSSDSIR